MISRRHHLYFFSFVILVIGVIAFIIYRHNASGPAVISDRAMVLSPQTKENRIQIRGLQFSGYNEEKKVISIKADRFTVEKKKIGFLTTSLFNVANLKNAIIDIYGQGNVSEKGAVIGLEEQLSGANFKDTFSKDALPAFPGKNVISITMEPVSVNLYIEGAPVTQVSALSANIRMKQRDIVFQGDVKVISGERTLITDRMAFNPEAANINTDSHFVLKTNEGQLEGEKLSADIFLMSIEGQNEPKETMMGS
jgi:hypothetical protein